MVFSVFVCGGVCVLCEFEWRFNTSFFQLAINIKSIAGTLDLPSRLCNVNTYTNFWYRICVCFWRHHSSCHYSCIYSHRHVSCFVTASLLFSVVGSRMRVLAVNTGGGGGPGRGRPTVDRGHDTTFYKGRRDSSSL